MIERRETRQLKVGGVPIGGGAPITVQTMTKTDTWNVDETVKQIHEVAAVGCDIVRVAVPLERDAKALKDVVAQSPIPVIADIHFNHLFALMAIEAGVDCLRINPGNIGSREKVEAVTRAAQERNIPIRIGVNSGSIAKSLVKRVEAKEITLGQAMGLSAQEHIQILEDLDFYDIKVSLKATNVHTTIDAYHALAKKCNYPFHVGITEAGSLRTGTIKSSVGIGVLMYEGLCDTIRVSLTADPKEEIFVGKQILNSFGLLENASTVIACPTCGRIEIEMQSIVKEIEDYLQLNQIPITLAVMGCAVNGPGEAREADIGVAGGKGCGLIYRRGKAVRKVLEAEIAQALKEEVDLLASELREKETITVS